MGKLKEFTIDEAYLTDVTIRKEWNMYVKEGVETSPEDLVKVLAGEGKCSMTSSEDHPEFTKLREQLGADGYIKIERGWWNGDRVLKPFKLNDKVFKVGEQFSCAGAMGIHLSVRRKYPDHFKD